MWKSHCMVLSFQLPVCKKHHVSPSTGAAAQLDLKVQLRFVLHLHYRRCCQSQCQLRAVHANCLAGSTSVLILLETQTKLEVRSQQISSIAVPDPKLYNQFVREFMTDSFWLTRVLPTKPHLSIQAKPNVQSGPDKTRVSQVSKQQT